MLTTTPSNRESPKRKPKNLRSEVATSDHYTWTNARYATYTIQGQPGQNGEVLLEAPCGRLDCLIPGFAAGGLTLPRDEALHQLGHLVHANQGVCRFTDSGKATYTADLVFEIDSHVYVDGLFDLAFYEPIIRASTAVGRRIYDYLVGNLRVDPRYITTCVTRMGSRVTVDWRAFGPFRLRKHLAVSLHISEQACPPEVMDAIHSQMREELEEHVPRSRAALQELTEVTDITSDWKSKVEVDFGTSLYPNRDRPTLGVDGENNWIGPMLRSLGALHSRSGFGAMYLRTTPVPHDKFRPENANWLTRVSRSNRPEIESFEEPNLFDPEVLGSWPEARHPAFDHLIEGGQGLPRLEPAPLLQDLYLSPSLPLSPEGRARASKARASGGVLRGKGERLAAPLTPAVIDRAIAVLGFPNPGAKGHVRVVCPYCKRETSARLFGDGHLHCFGAGCPATKGIQLAKLAADRGMGHLVPNDRASNQPVVAVDISEVPERDACELWRGEVLEREHRTLAEARQDTDDTVQKFLAQDKCNVLIEQGGTGLGKTHTILNRLAQHRTVISSRTEASKIELEFDGFEFAQQTDVVREDTQPVKVLGLFPRDDSKPVMLERFEQHRGVGSARVLKGRRLGDNCTNDLIQLTRDRNLPARKFCNDACPGRVGCAYLAQFEDAENISFAGHHAHASFLEYELFENVRANVWFFDENPLGTFFSHYDVDHRELDALRCRWTIEATSEDVGLDTKVRRTAPNQTIAVILRELDCLLAEDNLLHYLHQGADTTKSRLDQTLLADGMLLGYLQLFPELVEALKAFGRREQLALAQALRDLERQGSSDQSEGFDGEGTDVSLTDAEIAEMLSGANQPGSPVRGPATPLRVLPQLVTGLLAVLEGKTSPVYLVEQGNGWVIRVTNSRRITIPEGVKVIIASATIRPLHVDLMFDNASTQVHIPSVKNPQEVTVIGDHTYSGKFLHKEEGGEPKNRLQVFETTKALIGSERARTGLPVAVIGSAEVMNLFNTWMLGEQATKSLQYPFSTGTRASKSKELAELSRPLGYLPGYSRAVEGSNEFGVQGGDSFRFCRSLVVLGSMLPPLGEVEAQTRGVFYDLDKTVEAPNLLDWSPVLRTIPIEGTECEDLIKVATMQPGYADPRANEILHHNYEAVVLQVIGRLRSLIPDPIDPTITPKAWVFGAIGIPGLKVQEVISQTDLRVRLGLEKAATGTGRGRKSKWTPDPEGIRKLVRRKGKPFAVKTTAAYFLLQGFHPDEMPLQVRLAFEAAGVEYSAAERSIAMAAKDLDLSTLANDTHQEVA